MHARQRARAALVGLTVTALVLITVDFRMGDDGPLAGVRQVAASLLAPVQGAVSGVVEPVVGTASGVRDSFRLRAENERLQAEVEDLRRRQLAHDALERERDELREMLGMVRRVDLRGVGARVIANSASNFEWLVTIDVGSEDGVAIDHPVVNGDGLVGRVIQVGRSSSRVLLAIDPTFFAASRATGSGEVGTTQGQGGELLRFVPVDPEAGFAVGDDVVTASFDLGLYPDGIPIGSIEDPGEAVSGLSRIVRVRPFVDFTALGHVFVARREAEAELPDLDVTDRDLDVPEQAPAP